MEKDLRLTYISLPTTTTCATHVRVLPSLFPKATASIPNGTTLKTYALMCATLCSMGARPTSTGAWFAGMSNLTRIEGLEYLNTSETTDMHAMFQDCSSLTTIYVGPRWTTAAVTNSADMFTGCTSLVGSNGTAYSDAHTNVGLVIDIILTDTSAGVKQRRQRREMREELMREPQ